MQENKPQNTIEGEFTDIPNESTPASGVESKALNSKGHERMAKFGEFLKNSKDRIISGTKKVGNGLVRLFKGGKNLAIEGAATVLSIDDMAKRGAMKVKDAAIGVKDAVVKKTRETITSARDGLVDAYHTTKEKGEALVNGGREKIIGIRDAFLRIKLEIALAGLKKKKEASEEKTLKLQNKFAEKMALLQKFV